MSPSSSIAKSNCSLFPSQRTIVGTIVFALVLWKLWGCIRARRRDKAVALPAPREPATLSNRRATMFGSVSQAGSRGMSGYGDSLYNQRQHPAAGDTYDDLSPVYDPEKATPRHSHAGSISSTLSSEPGRPPLALANGNTRTSSPTLSRASFSSHGALAPPQFSQPMAKRYSSFGDGQRSVRVGAPHSIHGGIILQAPPRLGPPQLPTFVDSSSLSGLVHSSSVPHLLNQRPRSDGSLSGSPKGSPHSHFGSDKQGYTTDSSPRSSSRSSPKRDVHNAGSNPRSPPPVPYPVPQTHGYFPPAGVTESIGFNVAP